MLTNCFYLLLFCASCRCICCVPGAMTCWYIWILGFNEKPWKGMIEVGPLKKLVRASWRIVLFYWYSHMLMLFVQEEQRARDFFSMLFGCLISLWKEFRAMGNGLCFAPMKCQVWLIARVGWRIWETLHSVWKRSKFGLYMLALFCMFWICLLLIIALFF